MEKLREISARWGLHPTEDELKQYSELISGYAKDMRDVMDLPSDAPPTDHIGKRTSYHPEGDENKYNAWCQKTHIQLQTTGKLAGRRVAIKDSISVAAVPTTVGSKLFEDYVPKYDATVVTRILREGGIICGTATCEDCCFSAASFTSASGPCRNPHDTSKMSGGSSSGCAVLLAADEVDMAVGGDQGGSIRVPSSWCGVVGLKPTHGLVPYTGAICGDPGLDHLGPMTTNVKDCALLLEVLAGPDGFDSRQKYDTPVPNYATEISADVSGLRVGLLKEGFSRSNKQVADVIYRAVEQLKPHVASMQEVSVPYSENSWALFNAAFGGYSGLEDMFTHYGQAPVCGGFQNMDVYEHMRQHLKNRLDHISPIIKLALYTAEYMKETDGSRTYCHAVNCINKLRKEFSRMLKDYDVLIMPTTTYPPQPFPPADVNIMDMLNAAFGMNANTKMFNLTGHPALSINAGFIDGLPVGMMIVAGHYQEQTILNLALTWEQLRNQAATTTTTTTTTTATAQQQQQRRRQHQEAFPDS